MCGPVAEMSSREVLSAFHRDAPYLFLGAAFVAVGLVSAAFAAIRRKHDPLLIYLALFAVLYGLRLWIQASLLGMTVHGSAFYLRLRSGIDYLILIPAFWFLRSLGMWKRVDQIVGYAVVSIGATLATATFAVGPSVSFRFINSVVVIAALIFFFARFVWRASPEHSGSAKADFVVLRWGLMIFVVLALWDNVSAVLSLSLPRIEPFGF